MIIRAVLVEWFICTGPVIPNETWRPGSGNCVPNRQIRQYIGVRTWEVTYLRRGSTHYKITWVQHRQHHRARKNPRKRMLSLFLSADTKVISEKMASRWLVRYKSILASSHPSKYWSRTTLHDFANRQSHAPTVQLPVSVSVFFLWWFKNYSQKFKRNCDFLVSNFYS